MTLTLVFKTTTELNIITVVKPVYMGSTTFRRGRLCTGRLGAADYAPGLLCAWTFMRRDF